eukprot:tig00001694_g9569.t1
MASLLQRFIQLGVRGEPAPAATVAASASAGTSQPSASPVAEAVTTAHFVPASAASECVEVGCGKAFGLTDRKVNCRRCGRIFCAEHAQLERKLNPKTAQPDPDGVFAKVCSGCYFDPQEIGAVRDLTEPFQVLRGALRERDAQLLARTITAAFSESSGAAALAKAPAGKGKAAAEGREEPACSICKASFGMLSRRRHCKLCGAAVCASCGSERVTTAVVLAAAPAADPAGLPHGSRTPEGGQARRCAPPPPPALLLLDAAAALAAGAGRGRAGVQAVLGPAGVGRAAAAFPAERTAALEGPSHTAYTDVQAAWRAVERELPLYGRHVDWLEEAARAPPPAPGKREAEPGPGGTPRLEYVKYERYRESEERLLGAYKELQAAMLRVKALAHDPPPTRPAPPRPALARPGAPRSPLRRGGAGGVQGVARSVGAAVVQFLQETTSRFRALQIRVKGLPLTTHPLFQRLEVAYAQKRQEREEAGAIREVYVALARMQAEAARHRLFRHLAADFHELLPAVRSELREAAAATGGDPAGAVHAAEAEVLGYEARRGRTLLGPAAEALDADQRAVLMAMAEVLVGCLARLDGRPRSLDRFHCTRYWLITLREKIKSHIEPLL